MAFELRWALMFLTDPASRSRALRVAWISDFPIEWLPEAPQEVAELPKSHPATWEWVLQSEFNVDPAVELHVCILRKNIARDLRFSLGRTTFHLCKIPGGVRAPSLFWVDTWRLRRLLKEIRPDIVHAWGTERGAALVASRLPYPCLVTIQGLLSWYAERVRLVPYERFAAWVEMWSLKRARIVSTESNFAVRFLQQRYPDALIHQAEHAANWLFHKVERRPQMHPLRIICIGTQGYRKGTDILLKALDALVREFSFELLLCGTPDEKFLSPLRSELSSDLWSRIRMQSGLPPAEIAREFESATLLALPTRADTSPNAVKEAAVAGVPVVATAIGGIPDYIFPDRNGILCPPDNVEAFTDALRTAFQHPLFGSGLVEPYTLREVRSYLSPTQMKHNFLAAYRKCLATDGGVS